MSCKVLRPDTAANGTFEGGIVRAQERNPFYQDYAHLLPSSGRYPARHVEIVWNWDANYKVKDVEVVFIVRDGTIEETGNFWRRVDIYSEKWDRDIGNSYSGWLQEPALTPEGAFGALLGEGFSNETELRRALEEFAHIQECRWARKMLAGFNA